MSTSLYDIRPEDRCKCTKSRPGRTYMTYFLSCRGCSKLIVREKKRRLPRITTLIRRPVNWVPTNNWRLE